jgi:hypothetical protein
MPRLPRPREMVLNALITVVLATYFPTVYRRIHWVLRAGPRGIALRVALEAAGLFAVDRFARFFENAARKRAEIEARLREELGRPPWPEEIEAAWREAYGFADDDPGLR